MLVIQELTRRRVTGKVSTTIIEKIKQTILKMEHNNFLVNVTGNRIYFSL